MEDARIFEFLKKHNMICSGGLVLVAVSGGIDSMCLLDFLRTHEARLEMKCAAAHFNHALRGEESKRDQEFVREYCAKRQIPFYTETGDVKAAAAKKGMGIEETAREMRYEFLYRTADLAGADRIATAHTADDNIETVIMNVTRGTGIKGLSGIPPVRGRIIRPWLLVSRNQIEEYAEKNSVPFEEDSTNADDIYTRNKIRHQVIPVLKGINPDLCGAVSSMTELVSTDSDYLDALAGERFPGTEGGDIRMSVQELLDMPRPVMNRVIRLASSGLNAESGFNHLSGILRILEGANPSGRISLGNGCVARREYGEIVFSASGEAENGFKPVEIIPGDTVFIPELGFRIVCEQVFGKNYSSFNTFLFKTSEICGKMSVRPRMTGDKIAISGRNGTKSLKKLMIDAKIPRDRRNKIPVFADESGVIAVYGFGVGKQCSADGIYCEAIKVTIEEI